MRQFDHIIWDWNGTIVDDTALCLSILNTQLVKNKMPQLSLEEYRSSFVFPLSVFYQKIGLAFTPDTFREQNISFLMEYKLRRRECRLHQGVNDVLDGFLESGGTHSVLSAYVTEHLTEMVRQYGIADKFKLIQGLDHTDADSKVDKGYELLKQLDLKPSRTMLVGDSTHDFDVARALGVQCFLVAKGHQSRDALSGCQAVLCEDHKEILSYL
ncbi:MAG: HAD family hydrolase [Chitinispirillaceae bacterium]